MEYEVVRVDKRLQAMRAPDGSVLTKEAKKPKTVYDPNILTDEYIFKTARQALDSELKLGKQGTINGSFDGIDFEGYVDKKTGKLETIYPIVKKVT